MFTVVQILLALILVVYLLNETKHDFIADVVKESLEMERLFCRAPAEGKLASDLIGNEHTWISLVRPV